MTRETLLALAAKAEAAKGADREIDRAIMEALSLKPDYAADWGPRDNCRPAPFAYTASLDAAMTLVTEGCQFYVDNGSRGLSSHARVLCAGAYVADGVSPALALTAACLRARAACLVEGEAK